MAGPLDLLKKIREADDQTEVQKSAENETLHAARIQQYLEENEITADNFDDKFNFNSALEILRMKQTRGEVMLERELLEARDYLEKVDLNAETLLSDKDPDTFRSDIHKELMAREALDQEKKLINAHAKYLLIRQLAYRRLQIHAKFEKKREEEKVEATGSLKESISEKFQEVKKNFKNMSKGEKVVAVGAMVFATVWLFSQSDNPKVQKFKDYAWKGIKLIGIGVGANYAWKLFRGKTAWEDLNDYTRSTAGGEGFWKDTYKTSPENAETMQKSMVYMGDQDFMDLTKRYRDAKASKKEEIRMMTVAESDMSSKEMYASLDTFFKRYPVDAMQQKYKNWRPENRTWRSVVSNEMAEDGRLEFKGDVLERAYDTARYGINNGYNWMVADGFGATAWLYKKIHGREGTEAEVKEWIKGYFENVVQDEAGLKEHLSKDVRAKSAKNYSEVVERGHLEEGVKFLESADDSIYVMSDVKIENVAGDEKAMSEAWKKAHKQIEDFLVKRFPTHKENIGKFMLVETGACAVENMSFYLFARMPLPGTAEYHALNTGTKTTEDMLEQKQVEVFKGDLRYNDLEKWEQEKLRIWYQLDASQKEDIDKIMAEITRRYKVLAVPIHKVKEDLFNDKELRDKVLKTTGVEQKLRANTALLEKVEEIEKDAAADIKGKEENFGETIEQLKMARGYKVRLAVLGDSAAQAELKYDPLAHDGFDDLIEAYEKECDEFVERRNKGLE